MRLVARFSALTVGLALLLSAGCYQVPVTGRSAISMVSDKDVARVSLKAFGEMKKKHRVSTNKDLNERVQRVGGRLARVVFWDVPDADWEFVVFEEPKQINAFAMAGGKVGVFSGLFKIIKNDDQLAAVLAHEIGHVAAHHVNEMLSQQMVMQGGGLLLGGVLAGGAGASALSSDLVLQAYGLSAGLAATGFDRKKEKEADRIGIMYMARAGYNPEESVKVIENLETASAGQPAPSAWLSTHPSNPERILQLMDLMPKAMVAYRKSSETQIPVPIL